MKKQLLECHIVRELNTWARNKAVDSNWDYDKYSSPYIEFGPRTEISCGQLERLEIHVGNTTEVYFEECRFKPVKLIVAAVPYLGKRREDADFHTFELYQHPDGTLYSRWKIVAYDKKDREVPVMVPFEYETRDLLSIPKANKLLKRNPIVLKEITDRIAVLEEIRRKMTGLGKS